MYCMHRKNILSHQSQLEIPKPFSPTIIVSADNCFGFIDSLSTCCAILGHTARGVGGISVRNFCSLVFSVYVPENHLVLLLMLSSYSSFLFSTIT